MNTFIITDRPNKTVKAQIIEGGARGEFDGSPNGFHYGYIGGKKLGRMFLFGKDEARWLLDCLKACEREGLL